MNEVTVSDDKTVTISYKDGKQSSMEIVQPDEHSFYDIAEGEPVVKKVIKNEGKDDQSVTTYDYVGDDDWKQTTVTTNTKDGKIITQYESTKNAQGEIEKKLVGYNATYNDGSRESLTPDSKGNFVLRKTDKNGSKTYVQYDENEKMISQTYTNSKGKETVLNYDGKGNTYMLVQFGENAEVLADKFGCTPEQIKELNQGAEIKTGKTVLVPGTFDPSDPAISSRKDLKGLRAEWQADQKQKRTDYYKSLGISDFSQQGKKVTIKVPDKSKGTETVKVGWGSGVETESTRWKSYKDQTFTVVGKLNDSEYYMVKGQDGNLYYADSKFSAIQNPDGVNAKRFYNQNSAKKQTADGYTQDRVDFVKTGQKDKYGNDVVIDKFGRTGIFDKGDGKLYINKETNEAALYEIAHNKDAASGIVNAAMKNNLENAQNAFNAQLDSQGWTSEFADWCGSVYGSDNTEEKVRKDLDVYKKQMKLLQNSSKEDFAKNFKSVFGVEYNGRAMAAYYKNPNAETYKTAFGSKNDIAKRVEEYNRSQNQGSAMVKGGIVIGTGLLTMGYGSTVSAAAVGGASFAVETSDRATSKQGLSLGDIPGIALQSTIDAGLVYVGGNWSRNALKASGEFIRGTGKAANAARQTFTGVADLTFGAGTELAMSKDISAEGTGINAAMILIGHGAGRIKAKKPAVKTEPKPMFGTRDLPPSSVHVGEAGMKKVLSNVDNIVNAPKPKAKDAAAVRNDVDKVANRDLRRQSQRRIDNKMADTPEAAEYNQRVQADTQAAVDRALNVHTELRASEVRKMSELIKSTTDPAKLRKLKSDLKNKEFKYGGATADYRRVYSEIDAKLASLEPKVMPKSSDVINNLKDKIASGKGLSPDDVTVLKHTIAKASPAELAELEGLVNKAKMTGAQKKALKAEIEKAVSTPEPAPEPTPEPKPVAEHAADSTPAPKEQPQIIENRPVIIGGSQEGGTIVIGGSMHGSIPSGKPWGIGGSLRNIADNELVRVAGNNGKPVDANYLNASKEARSHLVDAMESGRYVRSLDDYINTINEMHKISAVGKNGNLEWYGRAGQGGLEVTPGEIRSGADRLVSDRPAMANMAEELALKYGDSFRANGDMFTLNLENIPKEFLPINSIGQHIYPQGYAMKNYYNEMFRTSREATALIDSGAPKTQILSKLAEHYQYAVNARPYGQINNSLFMNEINTLLKKANLAPMPHGNLDHIGQRLQPEAFKRYFIDEYNRTALR